MYIANTHKSLIFQSDLRQVFENSFSLNVGQNEIIKMRNNGIITDRDLTISKFLFHFKFATAEQLNRLTRDDSKLSNFTSRLNKLVQYRILNKFMLSKGGNTKVAQEALHIYCLDQGGRHLLMNYSNEDVWDWCSTANMKASEIISKELLVSEIFLRLKETCPNKISYFKTYPEFRIGKKIVIPSFEMSMFIKGENKYFIGEVVRASDLPVLFRGRVNKLEGVLCSNAWKKYYYESQTPPVLFIFADTDETAFECSKLIRCTSEIENFRVSTDMRLKRPLYDTGAFLRFESDPAPCLKEIKAVTFEP